MFHSFPVRSCPTALHYPCMTLFHGRLTMPILPSPNHQRTEQSSTRAVALTVAVCLVRSHEVAGTKELCHTSSLVTSGMHYRLPCQCMHDMAGDRR